MGRGILGTAACCLVVATLLVGALAGQAGAQAAVDDWTAYLHDASHGSLNTAATAVDATHAGSLGTAWRFSPPATGFPTGAGVFYSSPTVYHGQVFVGADNGYFYDLSEATGHVVWSRFIGYQPALTCFQPVGFASTATVANDPATGRPTVYVAGPDGYLYALDAQTGQVDWRSVVGALPSKTVNDYFDWSSPTVANGRIYVGVSSNCDNPLVIGGLVEFSQATGQPLSCYETNNPPTNLCGASVLTGGSVWTSAMVASDGSVFISTGNAFGSGVFPDSESIVHLDPGTLQVLPDGVFTIPADQQSGDGDFGSSPAGWTADIGGTPTQMVGACDKNGSFYAFPQSNLTSPAWVDDIGTASSGSSSCLASAVWDGSSKKLFLASNATTIGGTHYGGAIREVDPATGADVWQTGLPQQVRGTPSLDGAGVIAAATDPTSGQAGDLYLIDESTGDVLHTYSLPGGEFSQPVFAQNYLFAATIGGGIIAYQVPPPSPTVTSLSTQSGSTAGGDVVTIAGTNLDTVPGATTVDFGDKPSPSVTCTSATSCTATTPAENPGTVDVTATVGSQTSPTSAADEFTYSGDPPGRYYPLAPYRILDTRNGTGAPAAPIGPNSSIDLQVTGTGAGSGSVPPGATAAVLNVTATDTTQPSYLTVWPEGATQPLASNLNFSPGETVPNLVEVPLSASGGVSIYNAQGTVNVVADVEGYVAPASSPASTAGLYDSLQPARLLDTRNGTGTGGLIRPLGPGGMLDLHVAGNGGVPETGVSAVVLNVTATDVTAPSYLSVFPSGEPPPLASNLNVSPGQTVPNRVMVRLSGSGDVSIFNALGSVNVVADVAGYFTAGSSPSQTGDFFTPVSDPTRILDTRSGAGHGGAVSQAPVNFSATSSLAPVPADAGAVVANITVTDTTQPSYLTVYPGTDSSRPTTSDLNWSGAGTTIANLGVTQLGTDGSLNVYDAVGSASVIADVEGWYSP